MIFKNQDVNADINIDSVDLGNIHANFYTEDRGIASIRIFINNYKNPFNLTQTEFQPKLDLFLQDGSIFMNEPVQIVMADKGIVQYNLRDEVIKHSGKVSAKLFLVKENESIHVANFYFYIMDSGVSGKVQKEVHISLVEDTIEKLFNEPQTQETFKGLANDFLEENSSDFKGPKGDKGDKGEKGDTGPQGPQGIQGPMGDITGTDNWQKVKMTDNAGNILFLSDTDFDLVESYNLTTGFYYVSNAKGLPSGVTNYGYMVYKRLNSNMQRIEFSPFNSTETYIKNKVDTWMDWQTTLVSKKEVDDLKQTVATQTQQIMVLQQLLAEKG